MTEDNGRESCRLPLQNFYTLTESSLQNCTRFGSEIRMRKKVWVFKWERARKWPQHHSFSVTEVQRDYYKKYFSNLVKLADDTCSWEQSRNQQEDKIKWNFLIPLSCSTERQVNRELHITAAAAATDCFRTRISFRIILVLVWARTYTHSCQTEFCSKQMVHERGKWKI